MRGVGAGGGAVEEGDEELAHGRDAGCDYDDELFGPGGGGRGISMWGVGEKWEEVGSGEESGVGGNWALGRGTYIIQMTRSTVSTGVGQWG